MLKKNQSTEAEEDKDPANIPLIDKYNHFYLATVCNDIFGSFACPSSDPWELVISFECCGDGFHGSLFRNPSDVFLNESHQLRLSTHPIPIELKYSR